MTPVLTVHAPPEAVLATAHILARTRTSWGALEADDFVGAACLAFYAKRDYVHARARDFHNLMVRIMANAMRDETRREVRQSGVDVLRLGSLPVQGFASKTGRKAGGGSASSEIAQHRRRAARSEHNRTYYYRHVGLQACEVCGDMVNRGHGAKRCEVHLTRAATLRRQSRERMKARTLLVTQEGAKVA